MAHIQQDEYVSFEDLNIIIREVLSNLDTSVRRLTQVPPGSRLQNLQNAVYSIDAPVVHRPWPLQRHLQEWAAFISGERETLDVSAMKYLCWVPEIATDTRFLNYVENSAIELSWRSLAGLVRSCHCRWDSLSLEGPSISIIRDLLDQYKGSNQVLLKWQANIDAVLGRKAPLVSADKLIRRGKSLQSFLDEWRFETESPFFQKFVEIAAIRCRDQINQLPDDVLVLLFRDLLSWPGWRLSAFKKEIGALILHKPMNGRVQETTRRFILRHKELGDPRLPINAIKWGEVPEQARTLFVEWLRQKNPFVFNEHVFQQGRGWIWQQRVSGMDHLAFEQQE